MKIHLRVAIDIEIFELDQTFGAKHYFEKANCFTKLIFILFATKRRRITHLRCHDRLRYKSPCNAALISQSSTECPQLNVLSVLKTVKKTITKCKG